MKKVSLLSIALLVFAQISMAQVFTSSFENWSGPNSPDGWIGNTVAGNTTTVPAANITQSTDAQNGSFSCRLENTTSTHTRFTTSAVDVTAGEVYSISFWAKGTGDIRTSIVTLNAGNSAYATYNPYISLTGTWTQYTQSITANNTSLGEFIFSIRNSVGPNHIMIDNVVITTASVSTVAIYDIQYTANPDGISPLNGQTLTTSGVVTGTYVTTSNQHGYFIQDAPGAWNGLHVFQGTNSTLPTIGNQVQVTGTVAEFNGLTQLTNVTTVVINQSVPQPAHTDITTLQLSSEEQWEGVLVRVVDATCTEQNSGFGMWQINDGTGNAKVHNLMMNFTPVLNNDYTIVGVVNYSFDEYRICPRNLADINGGTITIDEVSISQIQNTTASDGASPLAGQTVSTRGVVTGVWPTQGFFIQDGTGPWRGIFVFNSTINPAMGDSIALTGNVVEFFGLTQISSVSQHTIVSSGNPLPAPAVITTAQANTEQYESVLVRVENAICTNANAGFGMFRLNNSTADVLVDDDIFAYTAVLGNGYHAQGLMWYSFSEFKMLPRMASDIELVGFASTEENAIETITLYPNPAETTISITNFEGAVIILDASGRTVQSTQIDTANASLNIETLESGVYFVVAGDHTLRFVKQ